MKTIIIIAVLLIFGFMWCLCAANNNPIDRATDDYGTAQVYFDNKKDKES